MHATEQPMRPVGARLRGRGGGAAESAADVHEAAAWLAHKEFMRLVAVAPEDVQHSSSTPWRLLTDRNALGALVGQLMPALSAVPIDVAAAATALAKVMLEPGLGYHLHSLKWVFALLQRIQVTAADSEPELTVSPCSTDGSSRTQALRWLPSGVLCPNTRPNTALSSVGLIHMHAPCQPQALSWRRRWFSARAAAKPRLNSF